VSALSLTACVLLIALWVRSYWWSDSAVVAPPDGKWYGLSSLQGRLSAFVWGKENWNLDQLLSGWTLESDTVEEFFARDKGMGMARDYFGFWFNRLEGGGHIIVPHLLPIFLAGALSVSPWIRWSNRFTLRTLLIATAIVAVWLGLLVVFVPSR
jgi:hypothetical protein